MGTNDRSRVVTYGWQVPGGFHEGTVAGLLSRAKDVGVVAEFDTGRVRAKKRESLCVEPAHR